ncbi:hypothetical protein CMZ82_05810 [Lysobacteraceae bacterium NML93-0792]|nr:hypothetical protein CMZ82_05810 [Xanthomonadaceae bacterium NML93-0792]PBS16813.1 hypothetical protein CMZ81_03740 [Xanthomonadaceae bacterium NML93-0793]PBS19410.1 hypothetical protein CMZ80_06860 [Xanthomonadaceae bacterium NML93-0831]
MKKMIIFCTFATFMEVLPMKATAQQPGTHGYNQILLPAHGVGDTRQASIAWGAFSVSPDDQLTGSATGAASEGAASDAAISDCQRQGGAACVVEFTYSNQCVAVAATSQKYAWSRGRTARGVRSKALAACGVDCRIYYEDCSFPGR